MSRSQFFSFFTHTATSYKALRLFQKEQDLKHIPSFKLFYPAHWIAPLSSHAKNMEKQARAWLQENHILEGKEMEEKFEKLNVGEYANGPFPHAEPSRAVVITKFLALWIFYDDLIEEEEDGLEASLFKAIAGNLNPERCQHPHLKCWAQLGYDYAKVMSPQWRQRHAQRFVEWIRSVREESRAAQKFRRTGVYPSSSQHLARRRLNIGNLPNMDFLEYQMEQELHPSLWEDQDFRHLEELAAEVVAITNDLFGFSKDRSSRWCNLVPCLAQEFQLPLEAAFQWSIDLHNARIRQIQEQETILLKKYHGEALLALWLQGMHHVLHGFARWHQRAPRYRSSHQILPGKEIQLRLDFLE